MSGSPQREHVDVTEPSDQRALYPSLKRKRVLITGGGSGVGEGIVESFARQGSDVTFIDICENGHAVAERTRARFVYLNLKDIDTIRAAVAELGPFDVLVNNAGNDDRHDVEEVTEAYWDDRLNVNLKHFFFCAQAVVAGMRERGGGSIVNLGSVSWHLGLPGLSIYQTAKAAIEGLTRSLARDLGGDNIRVNCVVPGNVQTERQLQWYTKEEEQQIVHAQCLPARLMPEDVAALILFLASDDARLMTGHEYFVDAGWR
jgi:NAD(P)-dependent dehydrogenase (short-subunit alcohol dehydrogenase family)